MIQNPMYRNNPIVKLTFKFSLAIIEFSEQLENKRKYNLSKQLFRCGTSIGANVMEAQNAESKADFVHKIKIALKEADETEYWLFLCKHAKNYPDSAELIEQLTPILKVLNKIVGTSKKRKRN